MNDKKPAGLEANAITDAQAHYKATKDVRYLAIEVAKPTSSHLTDTVEIPRWIAIECARYLENVHLTRPNERSKITHAFSEKPPKHPSSKYLEVLKKQRILWRQAIYRHIERAIAGELGPKERKLPTVTFADACRGLGINNDTYGPNELENLYKQSSRNSPEQFDYEPDPYDMAEDDSPNSGGQSLHRNRMWEEEIYYLEHALNQLDRTTP